jgi:hypothetical protein
MLLSFFQWCEHTAIGTAIRESLWLFPVIEAVHLLALSMIGGAVLLVDLRFLGLGLRRQSVTRLARDAHPWLVGSLAVMLATGILLFLSEPLKCYYNGAFWVKMLLLALAMLFTLAIRQKVATLDQTRLRAIRGKLVGLVSLMLWSGVGLGGRAIGLYGRGPRRFSAR